MKTNNSSTGRAAKFLMSMVLRMRKDKKLEFSVIMEEDTRNGM
jgi:hypothetical protein